MKRRDLIRHLEKHGCEQLREGGKHTIYVNRSALMTAEYLRERGERGSRRKFEEVLARVPDQKPEERDQL